CFYLLADTVIQEMESAYPELNKHKRFIGSVIQAEETRFLETLEKGLEMIGAEIAAQRKIGSTCIPREAVFKLYDTFGFPVDLVQNIAQEEKFTVDMEGFEHAMTGQRVTGRRAWKGSGQERVGTVYQDLAQKGFSSKFLGYQTLTADSKVVSLIRYGEAAKEVKEGGDGRRQRLHHLAPFQDGGPRYPETLRRFGGPFGGRQTGKPEIGRDRPPGSGPAPSLPHAAQPHGDPSSARGLKVCLGGSRASGGVARGPGPPPLRLQPLRAGERR